MEYIITKNESQYVKLDFNKKLTLTSNFNLAQRFGYKDAKCFINNQIKSKDRSLYAILEDVESEPTSLRGENTVFENENFCWSDTCTLIQRVFSELDIYKSRLEKEFNQVQLELTDIDHKIEFPKPNGKEYNAVEMVRLFQLQRDTSRRFRKVKDDLRYIHIVSESSLEDFISGKVMSQVNGMDNRVYRPRVLEELFAS